MKLLIVEDEIKILNSLKKGLEQESYVVDIASDGEEGYDYAACENYDLIILDLMLPGMNGINICQKLRDENNSTPIIMLTAKSEISDKVTGLNCGADDYLTKPFDFEELLARIKAVSRRPKSNFEKVLTCADIELDPVTYKVTRDNTEVTLSKKEYSLLEYFIRNKGKTLSKDQIIENVWSFESDILPNTVEVYVGYLRNKLEKPFKNKPKIFKTIRGFGYRMEDNV